MRFLSKFHSFWRHKFPFNEKLKLAKSFQHRVLWIFISWVQHENECKPVFCRCVSFQFEISAVMVDWVHNSRSDFGIFQSKYMAKLVCSQLEQICTWINVFCNDKIYFISSKHAGAAYAKSRECRWLKCLPLLLVLNMFRLHRNVLCL